MPFMKKSQPEHTAPPVENLSQLRLEFRHQLWKTILLFFIGTVVIAAASVAWFVSNSRVKSATAPVSAGFEAIKLATKGVRQEADRYLTLPQDQNTKTMKYQDEIYYYTDGDPIALRLDAKEYEISPGAHGKVTFYVIPAKAGGSLTLHIGLGGYGENEQKNVVPINDPVLNALMSGHILLFDSFENDTYTDWLFQTEKRNSNITAANNTIFSNTITVDLKDAAAGVPFEVTFFWIWPLRYENLEALVDPGFCTAQMQNMERLGENYKYSRVFLAKQENNLLDVKNRSEAYDLADEYIGSNAQYLYLTIQTTSDNMEGGQQE